MTAKIDGLVVEIAAGIYKHKSWDQLQGADRVAFGGGPGTNDELTRLQREFDAEIAAAGGIEAWRAQAKQAQLA